ncbi:MAG TPA: PhoU domain-containing protein, partial [Actinomycetota bacterium]|nr:PhoU domain-containing protein [Actinomycetota bacterium]
MNARPRFHDELARLERELLGLGDLAARAVRAAVDALVANDDARSERVIAGDDEIDDAYLGLDQG